MLERPVSRRVVEQGKVITAAGVSAGIDMALTLAARIAGDDVAQAIQLGIEYDPEPPFDSGSPDKAPAHVLELVRAAQAAEEAGAPA
jgi:transcriptional regulator GlxA family with amidase domain